MPKISAKQHAVLHLGAALILVLVFLSVNVQKAECLSTAAAPAAVAAVCNSTRIANCMPDDEEFLMESETNRRILQARKDVIAYKTLNPKPQACDGKVYGSCGGKESKIYKKRKCDYQDTCAGKGN